MKGNPASLDEALQIATQLESVESSQKAIHQNSVSSHTMATSTPQGGTLQPDIVALHKEVKYLSEELQKLRMKEEPQRFFSHARPQTNVGKGGPKRSSG